MLDAWVELSETAQLPVLLRHEALPHRGQLDVGIQPREVEVRGEHLGDSVAVPLQGEGARLILPLDAVEVQDPCELLLAGVHEGTGRMLRARDRRRGVGDGYWAPRIGR